MRSLSGRQVAKSRRGKVDPGRSTDLLQPDISGKRSSAFALAHRTVRQRVL
jgi:hypothetical protein